MNQLSLTGSIAERELLRYTPAGIPIVTAQLLHASQVTEAKVERQVEFEIAVLAAGEMAGRFNQLALGEVKRFTGFLARKSRNSRSLVFHIQDIHDI